MVEHLNAVSPLIFPHGAVDYTRSLPVPKALAVDVSGRKAKMRYAVPIVCGVIFILLILYLALFYTLPLDYQPDKVPSGNMDAHAITAGALQANADLLTTVALALSALFGFSINIHLGNHAIDRNISFLLLTIFGLSLTFVFVYAYAVYHAIAIQADHNVFYLSKIDPLINNETRCVMLCAGLSIIAFCWRCIKMLNNGDL